MSDDRVAEKLATLEESVRQLGLLVSSLADRMPGLRDTPAAPRDSAGATESFTAADGITLEALEAEYIRHTLERCAHNKTLTATVLGVDPSTLHRKLSRLGW